MEQKKYQHIKRLDILHMNGFSKGDYIVVQERIDGANFSIRYDAEQDEIAGFSRNHPITEENDLRGAWKWTQRLDKEKVKAILGTRYILFGEWLVPHTIVYPSEQYQNAFFYDVYDLEFSRYLPQKDVKKVVEQMGLRYVPVFYEGTFEDWEKISALVGRTELGGETGEGIVVKNMSRLNDPDIMLPWYVKLVTDSFAEKVKVRKPKGEINDKRQQQKMLVESIVTEGRVRKLVHKMVDEGNLPENWGQDDMGQIMKLIGRAIFYDCMKEEKETVEMVGKEFGSIAFQVAARIVKEDLKESRNPDSRRED